MTVITPTAPVLAPQSTMSPRTRLLLQGPIVPTLLRMAWPNVLVMLAQAATGLIETWWISHLGTDALAGMALVFPGFMMMQMLSGGAIGGGISSAIARALGGGRRADADALVLHALVINGALGLLIGAVVLAFGTPLYRALGGEGASLTALTVALTTALVAAATGSHGVAGYGTASRLEYLLIPLVFGLGAPMVALVGTNIGAGQKARALRIALTGGAIAFVLTEAVGIAAALFPVAWLSLFGTDPNMLATGAEYLRLVGPTYGFFGLGLSLYFASQGAGLLFWPLFGGLLRLVIAVAGGWLAWTMTGTLTWVFAALAIALVVYGAIVVTAIATGVWFR